MIRLAVIGCGAWGRRYLPSAREAANCLVTHVAGTPGVGEDVITVPSREWRRLLDADVDAFIVATPPQSHEEICVEILSRGRPVMVEKPMALNNAAALRIAQAARATGAPLLVAHQHLFAPAYEALRDRALAWKHTTVVSCGGGDGPHRDYSALWDYGPHDVAMFLGLARGCSVEFQCMHGHASRFALHLQSGRRSGVHSGMLRCWNDAPPKSRMLMATDGECVAVYDERNTSPLRVNGHACPVESIRPLAAAMRAFAHVVGGGARDWRFDPMFGVDVTLILSNAEARMEPTDADNDHN